MTYYSLLCTQNKENIIEILFLMATVQVSQPTLELMICTMIIIYIDIYVYWLQCIYSWCLYSMDIRDHDLPATENPCITSQ